MFTFWNVSYQLPFSEEYAFLGYLKIGWAVIYIAMKQT